MKCRFSGVSFACFVAILCVAQTIPAQPIEGVREVNLRLRGLAYDPGTARLYATSPDATNKLLQLDPTSGAVIQSFDIGPVPGKVALGAGHSLWVGLEGGVRRFNLDTFTPENIIALPSTSTPVEVLDIAPSQANPQLVAVSVTGPVAHLVRDGVVLPANVPLQYITLQGNFIVGQSDGALLRRAALAPNGLVIDLDFPLNTLGDSVVTGGNVYHPSGFVINASSFAYVARLPLVPVGNWPPDAGAVTLNPDTGELVYLSRIGFWQLSRFIPGTFRETGIRALVNTTEDPKTSDLIAWSTNRAAFHTGDKLFLLDLDAVFPPADVAVVHSADQTNVTMGAEVILSVVVTNKGPGTATQVALENVLDPSLIIRELGTETPNAGFVQHQQASNRIWTIFPDLAPGQAARLTIKLLTTRSGIFTNDANVFDSTEADPSNNRVSSTIAATPLASTVVSRIPLLTADAAWSSSGRLILAASGKSAVWVLDGNNSRLERTVLDSHSRAAPLTKVACALDGTFWAGLNAGMARWDPNPVELIGYTSSFVPRAGVISDLAVSPKDFNDLAVGLGTSFVLKNQTFAKSGTFEFSESGDDFYFADVTTCSLEVYSLTNTLPVLRQTFTNVSCSDFSVANGLVYFDNGVILNPTTGIIERKLTAVSPWYVSPAPGGILNVLTRTNSQWILRRFNAGGLDEFGSVAITNMTGFPVELASMGKTQVAIRTDSEVLVVNAPTDPTLIELRVSISIGAVTISFPTVQGATYQLDHSDTAQPGSWVSEESRIPGTGTEITRTIAGSSNGFRFYRVTAVLP